MRIGASILIVFCCLCAAYGQTSCNGANALSAAVCAGDELSPEERELTRIINAYRAQYKLPPVRISVPLNRLANRHLIDLGEIVGRFTHSWSDCPYEIGDERTWPCITDAPRRLKTGYGGDGFENLYRNAVGPATPALALEAWKKSPHHNSLILNLDVWKDIEFDAFGVAIRGNWAAMWFGSPAGAEVELDRAVKGLGVSFKRLVKGLDEFLDIGKESTVGESEKWTGFSKDKSLKMEIFGRESDISESSIGLAAKLDARSRITPEARAAMLTFLKNLAPDWLGREGWFDQGLAKLLKNPRSPVKASAQGNEFEMRIGPDKGLRLSVLPAKKAAAVEL